MTKLADEVAQPKDDPFVFDAKNEVNDFRKLIRIG